MATEPDVVAGLNDWVRAIQAERYFRSDNLGKTVRSFVSLPFGLPDIQPGALTSSLALLSQRERPWAIGPLSNGDSC